MNDFGTFQAIENVVFHDHQLKEKISAVVTEARPGMEPPYLMVHFKKSHLNALSFIRGTIVECDLIIVSAYSGEQELQDLMSRLDLLLQTNVHKVQPRSLDRGGEAVFKQMAENIQKDGIIRKGTLSYQVKVIMIKEGNNE